MEGTLLHLYRKSCQCSQMRNTLLLLSWLFCILLTGSINCLSADKDSKKIWTDPKKAAIEDPDFSLQGEYAAKGLGFQAAAVGNNKFYSSKFYGGLPWQGWDGSDPEVEIVNAEINGEFLKVKFNDGVDTKFEIKKLSDELSLNSNEIIDIEKVKWKSDFKNIKNFKLSDKFADSNEMLNLLIRMVN